MLLTGVSRSLWIEPWRYTDNGAAAAVPDNVIEWNNSITLQIKSQLGSFCYRNLMPRQ